MKRVQRGERSVKAADVARDRRSIGSYREEGELFRGTEGRKCNGKDPEKYHPTGFPIGATAARPIPWQAALAGG